MCVCVGGGGHSEDYQFLQNISHTSLVLPVVKRFDPVPDDPSVNIPCNRKCMQCTAREV